MKRTRSARRPAAPRARGGKKAGYTALASLVRIVIAAAREEGIDIAALLTHAGLPTSLLDNADPEARVDTNAMLQLWALVAEASADPFFGLHVGERHGSAGAMAIVGFAAKYCSTLSDALTLACRYSAIVNQGSRYLVEPGPRITTFRGEPKPGLRPWPRAFTEYVSALFATLARSWTGQPVQVGARFRHAAPRDDSAYRRLFGRDLCFSAPHYALVFSTESLRLPLYGHDAELRDYLEAKVGVLHRSLSEEGGMVEVVRTLLRGANAGDASLEAVAETMGTTARTLQRRLAREGHRFADVYDEVQRDKVLERIVDPSRSIAEVASETGYSSLNAFRTAFVRWTGLTPRAYRAQAWQGAADAPRRRHG